MYNMIALLYKSGFKLLFLLVTDMHKYQCFMIKLTDCIVKLGGNNENDIYSVNRYEKETCLDKLAYL